MSRRGESQRQPVFRNKGQSSSIASQQSSLYEGGNGRKLYDWVSDTFHSRHSSTGSQNTTWGMNTGPRTTPRAAFPILCWNNSGCKNIDTCAYVHPDDPQWKQANRIFNNQKNHINHAQKKTAIDKDLDTASQSSSKAISDLMDSEICSGVNAKDPVVTKYPFPVRDRASTPCRGNSPFGNSSFKSPKNTYDRDIHTMRRPWIDSNSADDRRRSSSFPTRSMPTRRSSGNCSFRSGFSGNGTKQSPVINTTAYYAYQTMAPQTAPVNSRRCHLNDTPTYQTPQKRPWGMLPQDPSTISSQTASNRRVSSASTLPQQYSPPDRGALLGAGSPYFPNRENTHAIREILLRQILYSRLPPQFCGSPRNRGPNVVFLKRLQRSETKNIYASLTQLKNVEFWIWDTQWEPEYYTSKVPKPSDNECQEPTAAENATSDAGLSCESTTTCAPTVSEHASEVPVVTSPDHEKEIEDSDNISTPHASNSKSKQLNDNANSVDDLPEQQQGVKETISREATQPVELEGEAKTTHSSPDSNTIIRPSTETHTPSIDEPTIAELLMDTVEKSRDDDSTESTKPIRAVPSPSEVIRSPSPTPSSSNMESLMSRETSSSCYSMSSYEDEAQQRKERFIREFKSQLLVSMTREREKESEIDGYVEVSNTLKSLTAGLFEVPKQVATSSTQAPTTASSSAPLTDDEFTIGSIADETKLGTDKVDAEVENEGYTLLKRLGLLQDERLLVSLLPRALDPRTLREKLDETVVPSFHEICLAESHRKACNRFLSLLKFIEGESTLLKQRQEQNQCPPTTKGLDARSPVMIRPASTAAEYMYGEDVLDFARRDWNFENVLQSKKCNSADLMAILRDIPYQAEMITLNKTFPFNGYNLPPYEFPPDHWFPVSSVVSTEMKDRWDTIDITRTYSMTLSCQRNLTILFRQCGSRRFVDDWCLNMDASHRQNLIVKAFTATCIALDWDGAVYLDGVNFQDELKKQRDSLQEYWAFWKQRQYELETMIGNTDYLRPGHQSFFTGGPPPTALASEVGVYRMPTLPPPFMGYKSTLQKRSLFCSELSDPALSTERLYLPTFLERLCLLDASCQSGLKSPPWLPNDAPQGDLSTEIARFTMPKLLPPPSIVFSEISKIKGNYRINRLAERITADRTLFMSAWAVHLLLQYWQAQRIRVVWEPSPSVGPQNGSLADTIITSNGTESKLKTQGVPTSDREQALSQSTEASITSSRVRQGDSSVHHLPHPSSGGTPQKQPQDVSQERPVTQQSIPENDRYSEDDIGDSIKLLWQWCDANRIPVEFVSTAECNEIPQETTENSIV